MYQLIYLPNIPVVTGFGFQYHFYKKHFKTISVDVSLTLLTLLPIQSCSLASPTHSLSHQFHPPSLLRLVPPISPVNCSAAVKDPSGWLTLSLFTSLIVTLMAALNGAMQHWRLITHSTETQDTRDTLMYSRIQKGKERVKERESGMDNNRELYRLKLKGNLDHFQPGTYFPILLCLSD